MVDSSSVVVVFIIGWMGFSDLDTRQECGFIFLDKRFSAGEGEYGR